MRTTSAPARPARFPTEAASFDVACDVDEALLRLRGAVRRSALTRAREPGLVGRATRDEVRVRWYGGRHELLPIVFDGRLAERPGGAVLQGHYRHARRTKLVCNFLLGLSVVVLVFGIMGMTLLWTLGTGAAADRWLASAFVLGLVALSGLALARGRLPLRSADCEALAGAITRALRAGPAR